MTEIKSEEAPSRTEPTSKERHLRAGPAQNCATTTTDPPDWSRPFLTEKQLAARWQISAKTLRNQRSAGIGCRYFKVAGFVRYTLADVLELERQSMWSSPRNKVRDV